MANLLDGPSVCAVDVLYVTYTHLHNHFSCYCVSYFLIAFAFLLSRFSPMLLLQLWKYGNYAFVVLLINLIVCDQEKPSFEGTIRPSTPCHNSVHPVLFALFDEVI